MAGWVLGQAGLKTTTRKGLAALILGANMPDIDVFFGTAPWDPLAIHRGFTHGLVGGVLVMPPILAGLLWLLEVDRFDLDEREVPLPFLRRPNLSGDGVAGLQVELPDLRR